MVIITSIELSRTVSWTVVQCWDAKLQLCQVWLQLCWCTSDPGTRREVRHVSLLCRISTLSSPNRTSWCPRSATSTITPLLPSAVKAKLRHAHIQSETFCWWFLHLLNSASTGRGSFPPPDSSMSVCHEQCGEIPANTCESDIIGLFKICMKFSLSSSRMIYCSSYYTLPQLRVVGSSIYLSYYCSECCSHKGYL